MEPYYVLGPVAAFVLEWAMVLLSCFLVFLPFIVLGIRKWKHKLTVTWWHIISAYLLTIAIYIGWYWWLLNDFDKLIYDKSLRNLFWLRSINSESGFKMMFIVTGALPILAFYSTKIVRGRFTILNFILTLSAAAGIFIGSLYVWVYVIAWGLSQIGAKYL